LTEHQHYGTVMRGS